MFAPASGLRSILSSGVRLYSQGREPRSMALPYLKYPFMLIGNWVLCNGGQLRSLCVLVRQLLI